MTLTYIMEHSPSENITFSHQITKFSMFYRKRRFITIWSYLSIVPILSYLNPVHTFKKYLRFISILFSLPRLDLQSDLLPSACQNFVCCSRLTICATLSIICISLVWFLWQRSRVCKLKKKLLIYNFQLLSIPFFLTDHSSLLGILFSDNTHTHTHTHACLRFFIHKSLVLRHRLFRPYWSIKCVFAQRL